MNAGVQSIIDHIRADAAAHSLQRIAQIRLDVDTEIEEENTLLREDIAKRQETLSAYHEQEYKKIVDRLERRMHRELLLYQHDLLDELFEMAAEKLRNASQSELMDMFQSSLKGLSGGFDMIVGALSKGKLDPAAIKEVTQDNRDLRITLREETIPGKGGFVLRNNRVEFNCLFEDLIEEIKAEHSATILIGVFGAGGVTD